jgi:hypothetical protein
MAFGAVGLVAVWCAAKLLLFAGLVFGAAGVFGNGGAVLLAGPLPLAVGAAGSSCVGVPRARPV